jgi:TetR/AcrR family transcriptional regulator, transcriptional repressor for nem operon
VATANAPAGRLTRKGLATRSRIVEAAAGLMFRHGVAGTSNEDVLAAAHVSNSQLYHYFPDKNALVRAVIEYQADGIINGQRPLLDQLDSLAAFRQWRDMLVDLQRQRHCEGGCPLGSLSSELAETDEPARTALAASFDRWEAPIRDGLLRMRDRGELADGTDVGRLALGTLAALQGGLLLTQAKRDTGPLEAALDLAISQISGHLT